MQSLFRWIFPLDKNFNGISLNCSILSILRVYLPQNLRLNWLNRWRDKEDKLFHPSNLLNGNEIKQNLRIEDGPIVGELLDYLSRELAYKRLNNFDEAIFKAKQWIEQNAPKCD